MEKSCVPVDHGFANPYLKRAAHLIANVSEYRDIIHSIQQEAAALRAAGNTDVGAVLRRCGDVGIKEKLRIAFNAYKAVPPTPPVIGVPPAANQLYGRFGDGVSIVDIGSGNCMKLRRYTGVLKITVVDPCLELPNIVLTGHKCPFIDFYSTAPIETIFTSFMAACQLSVDDQTLVYQHDGLHIQPDHELLLTTQVAHLDKGEVVVRSPTRFYRDNPVPVGGYAVEVGYKIMPTFAKRVVDVVVAEDYVEQSYKPVVDGKPAGFYDMDLTDMGWKWDGVAWELEFVDGIVYKVNRAGRQAVGTSNFAHHMVLHVEELSSCYVLLRLVAYRGYIPPHCGFTLRAFADRVKIRVNGMPICGPPSWRPGRQPEVVWIDNEDVAHAFVEKTDGVISRRDEKDLYCKYQWTADITDVDVEKLRVRLAAKGSLLECEDVRVGLWEYGLERVDATVVLTPIRLRSDKVQKTTLDTVVFMLDKPTLTEMCALD